MNTCTSWVMEHVLNLVLRVALLVALSVLWYWFVGGLSTRVFPSGSSPLVGISVEEATRIK